MKYLQKSVCIILSIMIISLVTITPITVSAGTSGDWEYQLLDDGTAKITNYNGSEEELIIPDKIDGHSVTTIAGCAFEQLVGIKSVTIPDSVRVIGSESFWGCKNLEKISLPNSNIRIGGEAFADTAYFKNKDNWSDDVLYIGNHLIWGGNIENEEYALKEGTITIAGCAFEGNGGIKSITIPDGVLRIGARAFGDCSGLESIAIPKSVINIDAGAFEECSNLDDVYYSGSEDDWNSITIDSRNECLSDATIHHNSYSPADVPTTESNETSTPDEITEPKPEFEYEAFSDGTATITKYNGTDINVEIPGSIDGNIITNIDRSAFDDCANIESITIPKTVLEIEQYSFSTCTGLKTINVDSDNPNYTSLNGNLYDKTKTKLIRYSSGKTDTLFTVPKGVTEIDVFAFFGSPNLSQIILNEELETIGDGAFHKCPNIKELNIPKNVSSISWYTFGDYEKISVDPENKYYSSVDGNLYNKDLTLLCRYATLKKDTEFVIPESVKYIWITAFQWSYNLKSITAFKSVDLSSSYIGYILEDHTTTKVEGFIIYGYSGSSAEEYAQKNGFEFIDLDTISATDPTQPDTDEPTESTETQPVADKPTEPVETQPTTDKPTEPSETQPVTDKPTESVVTEPQPTTPKPTSPVVKPTDNKKDNPVKVTVKAKTVKLKKLKKKAQAIKAITIKSAKGKVSCKITKAAKIKKYLKINAKGVITFKAWKKAKKGTYEIKVKITVKGNSKYKPKTIKKTVKIKIK